MARSARYTFHLADLEQNMKMTDRLFFASLYFCAPDRFKMELFFFVFQLFESPVELKMNHCRVLHRSNSKMAETKRGNIVKYPIKCL